MVVDNPVATKIINRVKGYSSLAGSRIRDPRRSLSGSSPVSKIERLIRRCRAGFRIIAGYTNSAWVVSSNITFLNL